LKIIEPTVFVREKGQFGVGGRRRDQEFQIARMGVGFHFRSRKGDRQGQACFLKMVLGGQGCGRCKGEIQIGMSGEAGFLADQPIDLGFQGDWDGAPTGGRDNFREQNGLVRKAVTDQGRRQNSLGKGKLKRARGESGW